MKQSLIKALLATLVIGVCGVVLLGITTTIARADITLIDGNSQITINPASQLGMYQWKVNGVNYDTQEWFWYRVGSTSAEQSIDTISTPTLTPYDLNGDGFTDAERMVYENTNLKVDVLMTVTGSPVGGGVSDIEEVIRITNKTSTPMDLHFFEYNNFVLSDHQDTVAFDGYNHVVQTGPVMGVDELYNEGDSVVTGRPIHEASVVPFTLNRLNDPNPTTLNGNDTAGPDDVSWAFQWNYTTPAGGTMIISKDKNLNIVPEPSSILLLSIFSACLALGWRCRKNAR